MKYGNGNSETVPETAEFTVLLFPNVHLSKTIKEKGRKLTIYNKTHIHSQEDNTQQGRISF
jgi:hypothetical protein